jgi:hypothetical protein
MFKVTKSGNSKLGRMYSLNLPAVATCDRNAPCCKIDPETGKAPCYALKGRYIFPNVTKCYWENLRVWKTNPNQATIDILSQIHPDKEGLCRIHASGDIPDYQYLFMLVTIAINRPNVRFMLFTKRYNYVNYHYRIYKWFPPNLTIIFSEWKDFPMWNPYQFPVAKVDITNSTCPNQKDKTVTCAKCRKCWNLKEGQEVIFKIH